MPSHLTEWGVGLDDATSGRQAHPPEGHAYFTWREDNTPEVKVRNLESLDNKALIIKP